MKALTLYPEHAEMFRLGLRTIETRSQPTRHRGPLALHAGMRDPDSAAAQRDPLTKAAFAAIPHGDPLTLGAIVATAEVVDCVRIVEQGRPDAGHPGADVVMLTLDGRLTLDRWNVPKLEDISGQLPFGDYSPGRWAWLLANVQPTAERCPWCWGVGRVDRPVPGVPRSVCQASTPCPVCWPRKPDGEREFWADGRSGRCDPIPAKGKQGLWEWTP